MKKYILILTGVFFLCSASIASAHTGLESSNPAEGAVVKENISKITLTFESKIENLSTMKVTRDGKPIDVKVDVNNSVMTGSASSPFENGRYQVNYKIIGADGHIIQKDYSFDVQKPQEKKAEEPKREKAKDEKSQKEEEKAGKAETKSNQAAAPLFIAVLLIVIIGAVLFIKKRKQ